MSSGPAIALSHQEIRLMLQLANASTKDIFYDLGCGEGLVCCVSASEFGVKNAVGIERLKSRVKKARIRVRRLKLSERVEIRHQNLQKADFSEATIVYYGLSEDEEDLEIFEKNLKAGCRFVMPVLPLLGIMPDAVCYPFYLSRFPFTRARTTDEWASAVVLKRIPAERAFKELKESDAYWRDLTASIPDWEKILNERLIKNQ